MAKVKMETKLVVPANILWDAIGRFGALGDWHPAVEKCVSDGESKGSTRKLSLVGGGTSTVEWSSNFEPKGAKMDEAVKVIQGIYQAGFDNLNKMYPKK